MSKKQILAREDRGAFMQKMIDFHNARRAVENYVKAVYPIGCPVVVRFRENAEVGTLFEYPATIEAYSCEWDEGAVVRIEGEHPAERWTWRGIVNKPNHYHFDWNYIFRKG